jgi:ribosome-binding protein aMBF1 (putative translation factor)
MTEMVERNGTRMEHQDWTTVVLKRRSPKDTKPAVDSEKIRLAKLEQTDDYAPPKKRVSGESIQALIRKRIELGLTQEKADQKCSFSKNTFKDIESHKSIPNSAQQSALQRHFGIQVKIDHI